MCKNTIQKSSNTNFKFFKHSDRSMLAGVPSSHTFILYVLSLGITDIWGWSLFPKDKKNVTSYHCFFLPNKFSLVSVIFDRNISQRFDLHDLIIFKGYWYEMKSIDKCGLTGRRNRKKREFMSHVYYSWVCHNYLRHL